MLTLLSAELGAAGHQLGVTIDVGGATQRVITHDKNVDTIATLANLESLRINGGSLTNVSNQPFGICSTIVGIATASVPGLSAVESTKLIPIRSVITIAAAPHHRSR